MKDEEMAEEYICNRKCQDDVKKSFVYCRTCTRLKDFLAGLKAGRPQWHDLQKDPTDLPENKRNVWCDYGYGYGEGFYDKDEGRWWIERRLCCSTIDAWCELPTFERD